MRVVCEVPQAMHAEVLRRAFWISGNPRPYHPTKFNCEIFANWLTCSKPESPTVNGWLAVAAVAAVFRLAA